MINRIDQIVPRCTRGPHWCTELCPVAHGEPCRAPPGDTWLPRGGYGRGSAVANYKLLRDALPPVQLTEHEQRYMRWLAGWDEETARTVASLFRLAGKGRR